MNCRLGVFVFHYATLLPDRDVSTLGQIISIRKVLSSRLIKNEFDKRQKYFNTACHLFAGQKDPAQTLELLAEKSQLKIDENRRFITDDNGKQRTLRHVSAAKAKYWHHSRKAGAR
jgi:hypothetical protein